MKVFVFLEIISRNELNFISFAQNSLNSAHTSTLVFEAGKFQFTAAKLKILQSFET